MNQILCAIFILPFLLGACAIQNKVVGEQSSLKPLDPQAAALEDLPDYGCSYFYFLWGRSAELEGKIEEAVEAYEKALVCDPDAADAMRNLAVLHIKSGRYRSAAELIDKVVSLEPGDIKARTLLAKLYAKMGSIDDAIGVYQALLADNPDNPGVLLHLGMLYAGGRRYDQAQKVLEQLVEVEPHSYPGLFYLGKLYREMRYYNKAVAIYKRALDLNWSADLALETGALLEHLEKADEAAALYRRAIELDSSNELVRKQLVNLYLRQNAADKAIAELEELRNIVPEVAEIDKTIARIMIDQKRFDEAIVFLVNRDEKGDDVEFTTLLVMAYYGKGEIAIAKSILLDVASDDDGFEDAVLLYVKILTEQGNDAEAVDFLRQQITDPSTAKESFYALLADLYMKQGEEGHANDVFLQAISEFPESSLIHFEYALFLDKKGDTERALSVMEQVLTLDPENPYALNYIGYTWADSGINLEQAREYIETAVSIRPGDGFIRDSLGWVYFKLGDTQRAIAELEMAVSLAHHDPTIYEHLGDAYHKAEMLDKALDAYRKSSALYKDEDKRQAVARKIMLIEQALAPAGSAPAE